jgi:hypothetical protein
MSVEHRCRQTHKPPWYLDTCVLVGIKLVHNRFVDINAYASRVRGEECQEPSHSVVVVVGVVGFSTDARIQISKSEFGNSKIRLSHYYPDMNLAGVHRHSQERRSDCTYGK